MPSPSLGSAAIWNTMMGTSLLTMPWAFARSGVVLGPAVAIGMSVVACITAIFINRLYLQLGKREYFFGRADNGKGDES